MSDPVFLHPIPPQLKVGDVLNLTGAEARHAEVKRLEAGERVVVSDGTGSAVSGAWEQGGVRVDEMWHPEPPRPRVTVVQAIPKSERAELAVDLMVQAGADRIVPWASRRTIAKWDGKEEKARAKWENAARSAAKQARRTLVPEVTSLLRRPAQLPEILGVETGRRQILVLHEAASASIKHSELDADELVLVVGPEGGVAPEELEEFAALGGRPVLLGPEVLRTATAAAVALGAIGALTGRWA